MNINYRIVNKCVNHNVDDDLPFVSVNTICSNSNSCSESSTLVNTRRSNSEMFVAINESESIFADDSPLID